MNEREYAKIVYGVEPNDQPETEHACDTCRWLKSSYRIDAGIIYLKDLRYIGGTSYYGCQHCIMKPIPKLLKEADNNKRRKSM